METTFARETDIDEPDRCAECDRVLRPADRGIACFECAWTAAVLSRVEYLLFDACLLRPEEIELSTDCRDGDCDGRGDLYGNGGCGCRTLVGRWAGGDGYTRSDWDNRFVALAGEAAQLAVILAEHGVIG